MTKRTYQPKIRRRVRETAGGRYLSVTLEPIVQTPDQVLAIYRRLGGLEGVLMQI